MGGAGGPLIILAAALAAANVVEAQVKVNNDCFHSDTYFDDPMRPAPLADPDHTINTYLECQQRCQEIEGCTRFTFYQTDGRCFAQGDAAGVAMKGHVGNPIAGRKFCKEIPSTSVAYSYSYNLVGAGNAQKTTTTAPGLLRASLGSSSSGSLDSLGSSVDSLDGSLGSSSGSLDSSLGSLPDWLILLLAVLLLAVCIAAALAALMMSKKKKKKPSKRSAARSQDLATPISPVQTELLQVPTALPVQPEIPVATSMYTTAVPITTSMYTTPAPAQAGYVTPPVLPPVVAPAVTASTMRLSR